MVNVLIPMAGAGSRFEKAGYSFPKPLIEVEGKPMIQQVVENLDMPDANFIFICQKEHYDRYALKYLLNLIAPRCEIYLVDELTEGAAVTTLLAKDSINNNEPLLISNCDQILEWGIHPKQIIDSNMQVGYIYVFEATHPKWSFVRTDHYGKILEVAEKKPISRQANCGVFVWPSGAQYVKYAEQMIEKNIRVNGEFYVAPVFNEAIADNMVFQTQTVRKMWGIGTPEDLETYLKREK